MVDVVSISGEEIGLARVKIECVERPRANARKSDVNMIVADSWTLWYDV